jgi:hypothetical protein
MHSFIHFPPSINVKAYKDAVPLKPTNSSTLLAYSDACWGSQIGSAVADGTLLPLFKFCSMNGDIVSWHGGLIGWIGNQQERTSLSSCEAEIWATNATSKKVVDFSDLCQSITDSGHDLSNISQPTLLYNINNACIKWSYNMTSKAAHHIELRENFGNGCKIKPSMFSTSLAGSIRPIYSLKKCGMAHISVVFGIHLCQDCQTSSICHY